MLETLKFYLMYSSSAYISPYPSKLIYLNSHPFEIVSRYRDLQPQVVSKLEGKGLISGYFHYH